MLPMFRNKYGKQVTIPSTLLVVHVHEHNQHFLHSSFLRIVYSCNGFKLATWIPAIYFTADSISSPQSTLCVLYHTTPFNEH
ncbi:unnamed protein product [Rhizophagus irregularis]|nr:unnamed protein product [Rhizophagus irregularis]CAB5375918.1 unnamed protein product [Rhizophagus irregularis]